MKYARDPCLDITDNGIATKYVRSALPTGRTGNQLIGLRSDPASLEREKQSVQSWRFEEKVYRSS
ncbi:hypothetical protein J6590_058315 [Homalodisca vitripennis]|nr:hypothetical protein J6590_058315 [Homalodisca vitripennis]